MTRTLLMVDLHRNSSTGGMFTVVGCGVFAAFLTLLTQVSGASLQDTMSGGSKTAQFLQHSLRGVVDVDSFTRHRGPAHAMRGETAAESKGSLLDRLEAAVVLSGADRQRSMQIFKASLVFTHRTRMGEECSAFVRYGFQRTVSIIFSSTR